MFRCVDDGFCSLEQADLIQSHVEQNLRKLYKIDEIIGKSLSKVSDNDDHEYNEEDNLNKITLTKNKNENNYRLTMNTTTDDNLVHTGTTNNNKISTSKTESNSGISSSMNLNNQTSLSSSKSNLSPDEIKPISPSSISNASPISN